MTNFKWKDVSEDEVLRYVIDFGSNSIYDSIKLIRDISLESCEETWTIHTERTNIINTKKYKALYSRIVYEGLEIPPFLQETFIRMVMNSHIAIKDERVHYKSNEINDLDELNKNLILLQTD